jgi:effector-binding domain-containing protein
MKKLPVIFFLLVLTSCGGDTETVENPTKEVVENNIEITQENVESKSILYIQESSNLDEDSIGLKLGEAYGEIMALIGVSKLEMNGSPLAITTDFSMENMFWAFNAAIPVNYPEGFEVMGRIKAGKTYAGNVVKGVHVGSYTESMKTYDAIEKYIKDNTLEVNGETWEEYVDDPTQVAPEKVRTFIYFPIK